MQVSSPTNGIDFINGGFLNMNSTKINTFKNQNNLLGAFEAMFLTDMIQQKIHEFYYKIYGKSAPPKINQISINEVLAPQGYTFSFINVFDRAVLVLVPERGGSNDLGIVVGGKASCSCTEGSCVIKSKKISVMARCGVKVIVRVLVN